MRIRNRTRILLAIAGIVFLGAPVFAFGQYTPKSLNISGGLYLPNGQPVTNSSVDFKLEVWDKSSTCKLYEESHLGENLSQSKGGFSLQIGQGSSVTNYRDAANATSLSWLVFDNPGGAAIPFSGCAGGVIFAAGDERVIRVYYDLGGGMVAMTPDVPIESSAYAMIADTLQGKTPSDFIQVKDDAGTDLSQSNVETVFSTTNYAKLLQLLNNTFTAAYSFNNQPVTNVGAPSAGGDAINLTWSNGHVGDKAADLSGVSAGNNNGYTMVWNATNNRWETGIPSGVDASKLPLAGGTMSGPITMGGFDLYNTGHITMGSQTLFMLGRYTSAQEGGLALTPADEGRMFYNTDLDALRVWNGTGYVGFGASGVAGGDLTGSYPNPSLKVDAVTTTKIADDAVTPAKLDSAGVGGNRLVMTDATGSLLRFKTCALGEILQWTGGGWACVSVPTAMGASGVTAGVYGSSTTVSQIGVNAQGVVTSAANVAINFPVTSVAGKTGNVVLNPIDVGVTGTAALYDAGNAAGELPILDGTGKLDPSVLPTGTGTITKVTAGTGLLGGGTSGDVTLSIDATNVDAYKLRGRDMAGTAPNADEVLMWNAGTSNWEPRAVPSAPVSSVAGRTGAVTLTIADIGGAISQVVASAPLTGGGTSGVVTLGLDANLTDAGLIRGVSVSSTAPTANQVLQYNGSGWVPTTLIDNAGVTLVDTTTDLTGGPINGTGTLGVNTGTGPNQILKLNGSSQIPAVDGSLLTSVNAVKLNGNPVSANGITTGYALKWNGSQWEPQADADTGVVTLSGTNGALVAGSATVKTISIDTGVTAGQIVQVAAGDKLPVIDGSNLTNINAVKLQSNDVLAGVPADGQVLTWNNSASRWEAKTPGAGADNLGSHIAAQNIQLNGFWLSGDGNNEGVFVNNSGYVGIGTATVTSGAIADFYGASASDSAVVLPRASSANRPAGVNGMIRYNTSLAKFEVFENNAWTNMVATPDGGITTLVGTNGALASGSATVQTISIDTGVTVGKIIQVAAGDKLPVIDGSNLTGISNLRGVVISATAPSNNQVLQYNGSGWMPTTLTDNAGVTLVDTTTDLTGGPINGTGTLGINTGTGANQILKLNGSSQIPAVDGSLLTSVNAVKLNGNPVSSSAITTGYALKWNGSQWEPQADADTGVVTLTGTNGALVAGAATVKTISIDTGVTAGQIVQVASGDKLPVIDGSNLTNINAVKLQSNDVLAGVPADGQVLTWNNSASRWEAKAPGAGADNLGSHIAAQNIQLNGFWLSGDGNNEGLFVASAGNVGVGTNTPNANAIFDINGLGAQSALLVPRDTQGNRPIGVNGMIRYNTSTAKMEVFENNGWTNMVTAPDGGITTLVGNNGALISGPATIKTISIDTGVTAGKIVQVAAGDKLPVIDGSQLTGISNIRGVNISSTAPSSNQVLQYNGSAWAPATLVDNAGVTLVATTTDLTGGPINGTGTLGVNTGTGANQILKLNGSSQIPAVDGSLLTNVNAASIRGINVAGTAPAANQVLKYNGSGWAPASDVGMDVAAGTAILLSGPGTLKTISVDVGIGANQIPRLNGSGFLGIGTATVTTGAVADFYGATNLDSAVVLPRATTGNRPATGVNGMIRYNTSLAKFEVYENGNWWNMATTSGTAGDFMANGTVPMTGAFLAATGTAATPSIAFNSDNNTGFYSAGADALSIVTGGSDRIRVNSSGNVGIGTTSPNRSLQVGTGSSIVQVGPAHGTILSTDNNGVTRIGSNLYIDQTNTNRTASTHSGGFGYAGFDMGWGSIQFFTNSGNTTADAAVTVTPRLTISTGGSVGINTGNPANGAILDVNGSGTSYSSLVVPRDSQSNRPTTAVNGMLRYNTSISKFEVYQNNSWISMMTGSGTPGDFMANGSVPMTGAFLAATGTAATPSIAFNSDNNTGFYSAGPDALSVVTGGADRLRIDSTGKVGVGTTAPSQKLHIYQNSNADVYEKIENAFAGKGAYFSIAANSNYAETRIVGGSSSWAVGLYGSTNFTLRDEGNTTTPFTIETLAPNNTLYLQSTGQVGIGTANTQSNDLLLYKASGSASQQIQAAAGSAYFSLFSGSATAGQRNKYIVSKSGTLEFGKTDDGWTADTPQMLIDNTGQVAIGTTTATAQLHVQDAQTTAAVAFFNNTDTGTSADGIRIRVGASTPGTSNDFVIFEKSGGTVIGQIEAASGTTVQYTTTSDRRLKEDIKDTHYTIEDLMKLRVRDYRYKGYSDPKTGFIAQELYEIYPYAVSRPEDESKDFWGVDYGLVTPLLVKGVQDVYGFCQANSDQLKALSEENRTLKAQMDRVMQENSDIKARLEAIERKLQAQ